MQKKAFKKKRLEDKVGLEESAVAPGTRFKGIITGTEDVRVSGSLNGDVQIEGLVWIKKGGKIEGNIKSRFAIIEGELKGNIMSAEHVEIRSEARVVGNIQTAKIAMAEGSYFRGEIHMPHEEDKPIRFVEKRQNIK